MGRLNLSAFKFFFNFNFIINIVVQIKKKMLVLFKKSVKMFCLWSIKQKLILKFISNY